MPTQQPSRMGACGVALWSHLCRWWRSCRPRTATGAARRSIRCDEVEYVCGAGDSREERGDASRDGEEKAKVEVLHVPSDAQVSADVAPNLRGSLGPSCDGATRSLAIA